jgi:hypothetical protein
MSRDKACLASTIQYHWNSKNCQITINKKLLILISYLGQHDTEFYELRTLFPNLH